MGFVLDDAHAQEQSRFGETMRQQEDQPADDTDGGHAGKAEIDVGQLSQRGVGQDAFGVVLHQGCTARDQDGQRGNDGCIRLPVRRQVEGPDKDAREGEDADYD